MDSTSVLGFSVITVALSSPKIHRCELEAWDRQTDRRMTALLNAACGRGYNEERALLFLFMYFLFVSCLQCFDTVGWAAGRASGL